MEKKDKSGGQETQKMKLFIKLKEINVVCQQDFNIL